MFAFICKWPDYGINRDYEVSADATDLKQQKSGLQSQLQVPETRSASQMSCETVNHSEKIPVTQASACMLQLIHRLSPHGSRRSFH